MLRRERLAVALMGEEHVLAQQIFERNVGGEALRGVYFEQYNIY